MNPRLLVWLSRTIVTAVVLSVMWLSHSTTQLLETGKPMLMAQAQAAAAAASAPLR
ncbi:hypothetical protein J7U46_21085 [Pelomonas sp. V22]|uniref:hypothetical protein n=1 Tax=Pelomonas sp. V22 TaxID=2822139 RepID=UPI0024A9F8B0|nr:hypothetical protein [Pelomonas sp. V22]MDI4635572.1 hypothetical protein [Pelomonas sp. V22]